MAHWVKIVYERKDYVINFERVSAFSYEANGRVTFWLPDCAIPVVVSPQSNPEDYQKIVDYIQKVTDVTFEPAYWVKINYDRKEFVINLNCISSFCFESNGRITFWLPDSSIPIVIHPASNPESYRQVVEYIQNTTGYSLES